MPRLNHKHLGTFKDGKFIPDNPDFLKKDIQSMNEKKGYLIAVPYTKMKSHNQNKYYWAVIIKRLGEYWGTSPQETHQAISNQFLQQTIREGMPPIIKSTAMAEWSTGDWEEYCTMLRTWAANDFGVRIETPDEIDIDSLPDVYY